MMDVADRISGSFAGMAVGDAVGLLVEGHDREIATNFVRTFFEDWEEGVLPDPFGQYSDDTQLTRELAASLVTHRRFDPADYAGRISSLFASGRVIGGGRTTIAAAQRLAKGIHWSEAGAPFGAAGNGAAMRAAPIGWLYGANSSELVHAASQQAMITHHDYNAVSGSILIAKAVSLIIESGEAIEASEFLGSLAQSISSIAPEFANMVYDLRHFLPLPLDAAHSIISQLGGQDVAGEWQGTISPHVIPSVLWALFSYLRSRPNYLDVIKMAISGGGNTDTTAAMSGALAGAECGIAFLPTTLTSRLNDQSQQGLTELTNLANELAKFASHHS
jgi:ADP-ribosylglycohydrolase